MGWSAGSFGAAAELIHENHKQIALATTNFAAAVWDLA
jgi:hypothetical protein